MSAVEIAQGVWFTLFPLVVEILYATLVKTGQSQILARLDAMRVQLVKQVKMDCLVLRVQLIIGAKLVRCRVYGVKMGG